MPKLIEYPRTNYTGAWELAEIVDDTGGKCAIETAARKLSRKVSGSFKAIIGSAVKFGLMTSKRELLSTTTLFKRIKHAYDKQEELQFHREAFLTPPLFTQVCRKFRGRELPIQMLDVILIREFGVEEINAQGVAKAFVEGCRMCAILDEHNTMADIDALNAQRPPRREIASPVPSTNSFVLREQTQLSAGQPEQELEGANRAKPDINTAGKENLSKQEADHLQLDQLFSLQGHNSRNPIHSRENDAIASLFGLADTTASEDTPIFTQANPETGTSLAPASAMPESRSNSSEAQIQSNMERVHNNFQIQIIGPGVNTSLEVTHEEDITIAIALLEKIRRQLRATK
jgi:hypothetical protein